MSGLTRVDENYYPEGYEFECPGCNFDHAIPVRRRDGQVGPCWTFNGDMNKPTFSPSLLLKIDYTDRSRKQLVCHSVIREGKIEFLSDCTHALAGKTVPL